jgi:hypothetical protein
MGESHVRPMGLFGTYSTRVQRDAAGIVGLLDMASQPSVLLLQMSSIETYPAWSHCDALKSVPGPTRWGLIGGNVKQILSVNGTDGVSA